MIPEPLFPEYRLILVWRSDQNGNGIRAYLSHVAPSGKTEDLQTSFHPCSMSIEDCVSAVMNEFFGPRSIQKEQAHEADGTQGLPVASWASTR